MKRVLSLSLFLLAGLFAACNSIPNRDKPDTDTQISAASYVSWLREQGKLPGIKKDDPGELRSVPLKTAATKLSGDHMLLTVVVSISSQPNTLYWYDITRTNDAAQWQVVEAWRSDQNGGNRVDLMQ